MKRPFCQNPECPHQLFRIEVEMNTQKITDSSGIKYSCKMHEGRFLCDSCYQKIIEVEKRTEG